MRYALRSPGRQARDQRYEYEGNASSSRPAGSRQPNTRSPIRAWFREAIRSNDEHWSTLTIASNGERLPHLAAADSIIEKKPAGVVAVIIELTRVSNFLSQLTGESRPVAFLLDRDGGVVAAPDRASE